jgi:hypothetical protein
MRDFVAGAPPGSALWVELEMTWDGATPKDALVAAHARGADGLVADFELARCGYHPIAVVEDRFAVFGLQDLFARC